MWPQVRVERVAYRLRVEFAREIDVRDLTERMDTSVGSPRALHVRVLAAERRNCCGERALHRRPVRLDLPPGERSAVVLNQKLVARHLALSAGPRHARSARRAGNP